jgi:peptide/nickel transport system permease protein
MGFISMIAAATVGVLLGALCGYIGGRFDFTVMRFLDIFQAIPGMLLTIAISAALGAGFDKTILALAISRIPAIARITRSSVMKVSGNEFLEAAEAIGCSNIRRIFVHVLPNSLAPVIVEITMGIASTVLVLASLSYIGLGIQPPTPEWGAMLSAAKGYIRTYPYMIFFPGVFIASTVLALNLAGDGLRDALDPKLKM